MNTSKAAKHIFASTGTRFLALLVLIVGGSLIAYSQQITGSIAGTVKDSSGAMVTTATINATGLARATTASADGSYLIQYLPAGPYTIEVNAGGFKKFVQQNIVVA